MILFRNLSYSTLAVFFFTFLFSCNNGNIKESKYGKGFQKTDSTIITKWDNKISPEIDEWFKKLCTETRFNGNVLVAKNGHIIYQNFYGYANYQRKDTLSLNNCFQTGSLSKPFTAMAVMILMERGQINYNDDVKKYIPGFPYNGVTIKELLSHRSGLPNYNYFTDAYTDRETVIFNSDVVKMMIDSVPAAYGIPNEHFDYCNTNFVLLSYIVEKVSKMPFEDFMAKEIFKKAGMKNTRIVINGKNKRLYKAATGYHYKWEPAPMTYQDGVTGDKGVYTTVDDLWRWNLALEQNLLVKKGTLDEAFQPARIGDRGNKNYGLGWRLKTMIDSSMLIYHTGWWRGFNALFVKDAKNDAVYIILSNIHTSSIYFYFRDLLGIIDPERHNKQSLMDSLYMKQVNVKDSLKTDVDL